MCLFAFTFILCGKTVQPLTSPARLWFVGFHFCGNLLSKRKDSIGMTMCACAPLKKEREKIRCDVKCLAVLPHCLSVPLFVVCEFFFGCRCCYLLDSCMSNASNINVFSFYMYKHIYFFRNLFIYFWLQYNIPQHRRRSKRKKSTNTHGIIHFFFSGCPLVPLLYL